MVNPSNLRDVNPWWKSKDKINEDLKIVDWEQSNIKYDPRIRRRFNYDEDIVYSLRGPRQVGKTTLIKLQIREFLQNKIQPWNIMYYTFDLENSPQDVVDVVKTYLNLSKNQRKDERYYLFLDEISSVKNWQRGVKWLWDQNYLKNCTLLATGSHTIDIKQSTERLPNRRGKTKDPYDKIMLPMKFSEYVSILNPSLETAITENGLLHAESRLKVFNKLLNFDVDQNFDKLRAYQNELDGYLTNYMLTGGMPRVVNEYTKNNDITVNIFTDYLSTILGELSDLKKEETLFKQLIKNVITNISWPVSWRTIWKDTDVGSVTTAINYMFTLRDMFVLTIFYQYDTTKKSGRLDKEKKIHFHDPFFLHVLNSWNSSKDPFKLTESYVEDCGNQGHLVEGIVGDHLIRLAFALSENKQSFDYSNFVYTWKYQSDKEVDFILADGTGLELPIEVKFKKNISKKDDLNGIYNFKKFTKTSNGFLITKDTFEVTKDYIMIPASLFLLLI